MTRMSRRMNNGDEIDDLLGNPEDLAERFLTSTTLEPDYIWPKSAASPPTTTDGSPTLNGWSGRTKRSPSLSRTLDANLSLIPTSPLCRDENSWKAVGSPPKKAAQSPAPEKHFRQRAFSVFTPSDHNNGGFLGFPSTPESMNNDLGLTFNSNIFNSTWTAGNNIWHDNDTEKPLQRRFSVATYEPSKSNLKPLGLDFLKEESEDVESLDEFNSKPFESPRAFAEPPKFALAEPQEVEEFVPTTTFNKFKRGSFLPVKPASHANPSFNPGRRHSTAESVAFSSAPTVSSNTSGFSNDLIDEYFSASSKSKASVESKNAPFDPEINRGPIYVVEFKAGRTDYFYIPNDSELTSVNVNDLIMVEADRGKDLGRVTGETDWKSLSALIADRKNSSSDEESSPYSFPAKDLTPKKIYRYATSEDISQLHVKAQDEAKALQLCQSKVRQRNLPMEVVDAEYQCDRRKLTFYFNADRRIDFRELVRELFKIYKTRIWMCAVDRNTKELH